MIVRGSTVHTQQNELKLSLYSCRFFSLSNTVNGIPFRFLPFSVGVERRSDWWEVMADERRKREFRSIESGSCEVEVDWRERSDL